MPKRGNGRGNGVIQRLISDSSTTGKVSVTTFPDDVGRKPFNWSLGNVQIPRNFLKQIHWIRSTTRTSISISGSGTVTENNQSFTLAGNVADYANYISVFDQFCIHTVLVSITAPYMVGSASAGNSAPNFGRLLTAIDFDNVTNISTEAALMDYSSNKVATIIPGMNVIRECQPCVDVSLYSSGYGVGRFWVDSGSASSAIHYGVRVMTAGNNMSQTFGLDIITTVIAGFRNNI